MQKRKYGLLLILGNYYEKGFPSWPEVMGIYGINLPNFGYNIDWILPNEIGIFHKIETITFYGACLNLIPHLKNKNKFAILLYILPYQFRLFFLTLNILNKKQINFIQVRDDVWSSITAILLKKIFGIYFIFNYSFPFYSAALDSYQEGEIGFTKLAFYKIEDFILKKFVLGEADLILPISSRMVDQLEELGFERDRMVPIPLGVEPEIFRPNLDRNVLRSRISISRDDFVFIYIGSIEKLRGLELILEAFSDVSKHVKDVKLIFVGDGNATKELKANTKLYSINDDVIFTGKVSYFDVPNYLELSDAALSIIKPFPCFDVSSPCKVFEYMIMKKPIIANKEIPEHLEVVSSSSCGFLIKYNSKDISDAMINMVLMKRTQKDSFEKMGVRGYEWVIMNRTFKEMSINIDTILTKMAIDRI